MHRILIGIAHILIFLTSRTIVKNKKRVPVEGPLLVVSNHLSVADPVLLGAKIGRKVTFMAKEELFKNKFSAYFIKAFGAIPVYRGSSNRDALRQASEILNSQGVLGMFPEGKRSRVGSLTPGQLGAALIAYHNKVKILPVSITGSETFRGKEWLFNRPRVVMTIGEPFSLPEIGSTLNKEQLTELTSTIMNRIAVLLPEKYQGPFSGGNNHEDNQS